MYAECHKVLIVQFDPLSALSYIHDVKMFDRGTQFKETGLVGTSKKTLDDGFQVVNYMKELPGDPKEKQ